MEASTDDTMALRFPSSVTHTKEQGQSEPAALFAGLRMYLLRISPPNCTKPTFGGRSASKPNTAGAVRQTPVWWRALLLALANSWAGALPIQVSYILMQYGNRSKLRLLSLKGSRKGSGKNLHYLSFKRETGSMASQTSARVFIPPPPRSPL